MKSFNSRTTFADKKRLNFRHCIESFYLSDGRETSSVATFEQFAGIVKLLNLSRERKLLVSFKFPDGKKANPSFFALLLRDYPRHSWNPLSLWNPFEAFPEKAFFHQASFLCSIETVIERKKVHEKKFFENLIRHLIVFLSLEICGT